MKRSKILFGIIAAAVVVVVALVILLMPGSKPGNPTEPGGTTADPDASSTEGGSTTSGGDVTPPTQSTQPSGGTTTPSGSAGTSTPSKPNNPYSTPWTKYDYITGENIASEMPASYGSYSNKHEMFTVVSEPKYPENIYLFTFGLEQATNNVNDYLYLNPTVSFVGDSESNDAYDEGAFFFHFIPSAGYITTFSDQAFDNGYTKNNKFTQFTFNRSMDYSLPANYVSEELPGTVWFTDKEVDGVQWIDVQVYRHRDMFTTLRIYLNKLATGEWTIVIVVCTDQHNLQPNGIVDHLGDNLPILAQDKIDGLVAESKRYLQEWSGKWADMSGLTYDDFIIDYRAPGKGTYFSHTGISLMSPSRISEDSEYVNEEIWAVSFRDAFGEYVCPITFYYCIREDESGAYVYDLLYIDHTDHYSLTQLRVMKYPGYSYDENYNPI